MRDTGPVLKDRETIVKNMGRAEKKARGLGGGLESKSVQGGSQERSWWEGNMKSK